MNLGGRGITKFNAFIVPLGVTVALVAMFTYGKLVGVDLSEMIASVGSGSALHAALAMLLSELVKAVRLNLLLRNRLVKVGLVKTMAARFLGNLFAAITPASIGGTPARAVALMGLARGSAGSIVAAVVLESLYDSVFPALVSLAVAVYFLPASIPVILASVYVISMWFLGLLYVLRKRTPRILELDKRGVIGEAVKLARHHYASFREALRQVRGRRELSLSLALTALAQLTFASSLLPFLGGSSLGHLGISFVATSFCQTLYYLPTPGGAVGVEYALLTVLPKEAAFPWRLASYSYMIAPGLLLLLLSPTIKLRFMETMRLNIHLGAGEPTPQSGSR